MAALAGVLIPGLIGGIAGLLGGGQQQKTQTSGTITNAGTGTFNQGGTTQNTSTPNLSPIQQALIGQFSKGASNLYNSSTNLNPYAASGLEQINQSGDVATKALNNQLAAQGLGNSPAAANAQTMNTLNTVNQGSQFLNQLPLLQRQLQTNALGGLINAFQVQPTGTTQTGQTQQSGSTTSNNTQTQQGTNLISGNPAAGAVSGLGAGLLGPSAYGGPGGTQIPSNLSNAISSLFGGNNSSSVPYNGPSQNFDPNLAYGG